MKALVINDKIYGRFTITEPVLIELITSPSLQRLKKIEQHGTWQFHKTYRHQFNRYEHSVGVMLLLRHFQTSLDEQVHGLLHDISHTAFSHVSDFLFGSDSMKHDYQDNRIAKAYELQGINKILKKHGIDSQYILNEKNFPLAENLLPDLCADRIDYTLRDPWGRDLTAVDPKLIFKNLRVVNQKFAFTSKTWAKKFAKLNFLLNQNVWCHPMQVSIYVLSANMLREALNQKIITKKDLYLTDKQVTTKLRRAKNPMVTSYLKQIQALKVKEVSRHHADFVRSSKPRIVNPFFINGQKLTRLMDVDAQYKKQTATWVKKVKRGFNIKIINS
ncbi:MAG: HD domain-containing protein [Candidatus Buchananbacteria bacterium]|nr:HD domain-containing protein [Candidatus Buchananbacteria bacterium]